jgi:NAD(P)H-quinone oxidoreductase subunit 5
MVTQFLALQLFGWVASGPEGIYWPDIMLDFAWLVPAYGLIGTLMTLPWSLGLVRRTGPRPAAYFNLLMTLLAFIHGSIAFRASWFSPPQQLLFEWLHVADLRLYLALEISPVSLGAMELVTGIGLLAQIYALGYMEKDTSLARFFGLMGFFEAALAGIALSDSLFLSYGLLEMLTLSTYLLVGFWYAQPLVVTAARDAFLTKRVGDIILLMGLVTLSSYGTGLTFSELSEWPGGIALEPLTAALLGLSLVAGPTGKCAQFPLNLWLDEAMEGPTPASIMRNSVVVSMGAYVLIQLQPVFALSPIPPAVLVGIGTVTAIGSSFMAIAQIDIKRTVSHSTSAYLGLVFIAVGLGLVNVALIVLVVHTLTKALIVMSVGSVIATTNNQNVTEMGMLWSRMPATTAAFLTGTLGLVGFLPLISFWILEQGFSSVQDLFLWPTLEPSTWWLLGTLAVANFLSGVNLLRVFRLTFLGAIQPKTRRAPEVAWPMALPMVILIVVIMLAFVPPLVSLLEVNPENLLLDLNQFQVQLALGLLIGSTVGGLLTGGLMRLNRAWARPIQASTRFFQDLFAYDLYIDRVYKFTIVLAVRSISQLTNWIDRYVIDGAVNLVGLTTLFGGQTLRYSASGQSQFYVFTIVTALSFLLLTLGWFFYAIYF